MALMKCDFFAESLGMCTSMYIAIPQKGTNGQIGIKNVCQDGKFKSLLLLHGLSDDQSIWLRRTSIERYASEYGIAVIMPCAEKSFYTNMKYGSDFYTYIAKEVPAVAREFFQISARREDSFVAGISMGGYGAEKPAKWRRLYQFFKCINSGFWREYENSSRGGLVSAFQNES